MAGDGRLDAELDRAALLVSAAIRPDVDVEGALARLDRLAELVPVATMPALRHTLFTVVGFRGDVDDYHAIENSLLDRVLQRRLGMPITLAVVTVAVGRRLGLELHPVAMPGHVLVKIGAGLWLDAFSGGRVLDQGGAEALFRRLQPSAQPFLPSYLDPAGGRTIMARMLGNLAATAMASGDLPGLIAVQDLRHRLADSSSLPVTPWRN